MNSQLKPARGIAPGRILSRELGARGWTPQDLAEMIGQPLQMVDEIVRGSKAITPETAIELAQAFGTSPAFWLNLESNYRLFRARELKRDGDVSVVRSVGQGIT